MKWSDHRLPTIGKHALQAFQRLENSGRCSSNHWKILLAPFLLLSGLSLASADILLDKPLRDGELPDGWTAHHVEARTAAGGYMLFEMPESVLRTPVLDLAAYTNVYLALEVAKFGRGADGPLTVTVSTDGGATWEAQQFDSPVPESASPYRASDPVEITALSDETVIRWSATNSPSGKRLRNVILKGEPAALMGDALPEIRFQGFEGTVMDHWSYARQPGAGRVSVVRDDRGQSGQYILRLSGSEDGGADPAVVFDNADLTGYREVELSVAYAARGVDTGDYLYLDLSYDDGSTWTDSHRLVTGYRNFRLNFGETVAERTAAMNPFRVPIREEQVRARFRFDEASGNDNRNDHYFIDDVFLKAEGRRPSIWFGEAEVVVTEGDEDVRIPVRICEPADATVHVGMEGTAQPGADFQIASTSVVFAADGPTNLWLSLSITEDGIPTGPQYARFTLERATGARVAGPDEATLFIRDADAFAVMAANLPSGPILTEGLIPYSGAGKRILRLLRPDIVAIQEVILLPGRNIEDFVAEQFGPDFHYYVEPDVEMPNGVISRWPIRAAGVWKDEEVFNREFVWATIDLPGPRDLHVVSVHFKAGSGGADRATRVRQARSLTNYIANAGFPEDDYLVIAGDLNLGGRNEETIQILEAYVSDAGQPADQQGVRETNIPRSQHYDFVLPDRRLETREVPYAFGGYVFTNGLVFDSRLWDDHLLPALVGDAADFNMQHLAVMRVFALDEK